MTSIVDKELELAGLRVIGHVDGMKWYYVTSQKTQQEFSDDEVPGLLSNGTIGRETLIWNSSMQDWRPAGEVKPEWFSTATAPPEAAPPTSTSASIPAQTEVAPATTGTPIGVGTVSSSTPTPPSLSGPVDQLAMASMVCGIVAVVMVAAGCAIFPCLGALGFVVAIPAVITGHMALGKIKQGTAPEGGRGQAIAGLIMGYTTLGLFLIGTLLAVLGVGIFALAGSGIPDQM